MAVLLIMLNPLPYQPFCAHETKVLQIGGGGEVTHLVTFQLTFSEPFIKVVSILFYMYVCNLKLSERFMALEKP